MSYPIDTIIELCESYGPRVSLPTGIDGARLMFAISGVESGFGSNCKPRHEPSYDVGGSNYLRSSVVRDLVKKYGAAAACSYGPWQVMLPAVPRFSPTQLDTNPTMAAQAYVEHMKGFVIGMRRPSTIEQIAETYNSGNFGPDRAAGVLKYASRVRQYYESAHLPLRG